MTSLQNEVKWIQVLKAYLSRRDGRHSSSNKNIQILINIIKVAWYPANFQNFSPRYKKNYKCRMLFTSNFTTSQTVLKLKMTKANFLITWCHGLNSTIFPFIVLLLTTKNHLFTTRQKNEVSFWNAYKSVIARWNQF